jgi:hypothetical protein
MRPANAPCLGAGSGQRRCLAPGGADPARPAAFVAAALAGGRGPSGVAAAGPGAGRGAVVASVRRGDVTSPAAGTASPWGDGATDPAGLSTSRDASSSAAFRASRSFRMASRVPGADSGGDRRRAHHREDDRAPNEARVDGGATNKAPRRRGAGRQGREAPRQHRLGLDEVGAGTAPPKRSLPVRSTARAPRFKHRPAPRVRSSVPPVRQRGSRPGSLVK